MLLFKLVLSVLENQAFFFYYQYKYHIGKEQSIKVRIQSEMFTDCDIHLSIQILQEVTRLWVLRFRTLKLLSEA